MNRERRERIASRCFAAAGLFSLLFLFASRAWLHDHGFFVHSHHHLLGEWYWSAGFLAMALASGAIGCFVAPELRSSDWRPATPMDDDTHILKLERTDRSADEDRA